MISYGKQSLDQSDIDAVVDALQSDWITQGPNVKKFENNLETYFGAGHACAVSNGTAALHLSGIALNWERGDVIITSPITFLATANCIIYGGATPDFSDIDPITYTLEPNVLQDKIKLLRSKGKKVKAIIGVDFAGHPCNWKALRSIADDYELQLVNDNCHALGAHYLNDNQYAVKFADVVTQSFHPVKHITTGEGGAILTNCDDVKKNVEQLRTHGMTKNQNELIKNEGPWYYEMHQIGYNYRITDFQCALGSNQMKKLDNFVEKRNKIARRYYQAFSDLEFINLPQASSSVMHAYHLFPLQIQFEKIGLTKRDFFKRLERKGINLQVHYIPVHLQPFYQKKYGFRPGDFPVSENFYKNEVSLPIYPDLSIQELEKVIEEILAIIK